MTFVTVPNIMIFKRRILVMNENYKKQVISEYMSDLGKRGGGARTQAQAEQFRKYLLGKGGRKKGVKNAKNKTDNA